MKSSETDGVYSALRRIVISEPEAAGDTDMASILAQIDTAMTRSAAAEGADASASQPAAATDAVPDPAPAPRESEPEQIERAAESNATNVANTVNIAPEDPEPNEPPARTEAAGQPIGSGAEFRSRLNWFIGVSDVRAQDPGSLTYEPYFGLREKPFSLSADPRFFFSRSSHGVAFDTLAAGIRRREGILVVTGEVGTGKTTLCRAVLQSLDQKTFAAIVPDPFLSREDLLKTLLVDFGVVSVEDVRSGRLRGASRADLSYPLYDFLASLQPLRAFAVVMIDEAQNLTPELLEEIRILSDLENGQKLLEVVLVGQPELQARLASSEMRQLRQRVAVQCDLSPLSSEDVKAYIAHRLTIAGNDGRVQFADAATDLVATASNGIPRVINLLCDRALLLAARARRMRIEAEHVMSAVSELKLPVSAALQQHEAPPQPQPQERMSAPTLAPAPAAPALAAALPPAPIPAPVEEYQPDSFAFFHSEYRPAESFPPPDTLAAKPGGLVRKGRLSPLAFPDATPDMPAGDRAASRVFGPALPTPDLEPAMYAAAPSRQRWLLPVGVGLVVLAVSVAFQYSTSQTTSSTVSPPAASRPEPPSAAPAVTPPSAPEAASSARATQAAAGLPAAAPATARFAIQMATFQTAARAQLAVQELRDAGYQAYSVEASVRDGGRAFAVLLGPYAERAAAARDLARQIPGYGTGVVVEIGPTAPAQKAR